jgi:hypothetical protein
MANMVEHMPDEYETRRKYDWNRWLDGNVWELKEGEDFIVPLRSIAAQAYQAANRRGLGISVSVNSNEGWVRVRAAEDDVLA